MENCHNHIILLFFSLFCLLNFPTSFPQGPEIQYHLSKNWLNHGGNIYNRRYAEDETLISPSTASQLYLKWKFNVGDDVSATPTIFDGILYFPSWNGNIYAVKAANGALIWKKNIQKLTGLNITVSAFVNRTTTFSRATPTIADDDKLIIAIYGPAYVIAVKRATGQLIWKTQLDKHPGAVITMSGTYYNKSFYVGASSIEEYFSSDDCCTFRGSFAKLDIQTGAILWRTYMLPDNNGNKGEYAGGAVWGSSPSIDEKRNNVYIATGNLYSVPQSVEECQERQNNQTVPTHPEECIGPEIHFNSILAIDLDSGDFKWYTQLGGYDVWVIACSNPSSTNCPAGPNPDADFGEAPMMLSVNSNGTKLDIVVTVQKSGWAWALDRSNGSLIWATEAGPGGIRGGGTWGAATDTRRIYTSIANSENKNFTLRPSKNVTDGGGWVSMDASTGRILWSTAVPYNDTSNPVTIANGVLFAGSTYKTGPVYAIDASSGEILWSYETGGSVYGGFSVSKGCAYVGNGYRQIPFFTQGTSLFAFCIKFTLPLDSA